MHFQEKRDKCLNLQQPPHPKSFPGGEVPEDLPIGQDMRKDCLQLIFFSLLKN